MSSKGIRRTNYILKKPDLKKRRSFSILKMEIDSSEKRQYVKLDDPRIEALNLEWERTQKTPTELARLTILAKEIIKSLNDVRRKREGKDRTIKHQDNETILDDFFKERLHDRTDITSHKTQELDMIRAVSFLGNLSLKTAAFKDIQKAVGAIEKPNINRRVCSRINSLLGFIGRRERLRGPEAEINPFVISEEEFNKLWPFLESTKTEPGHDRNIQNLFITLYYTGMRMGEAFALQDSDLPSRKYKRRLNYIRGTKIAVNSQMLIDCTFGSTKTGKARVGYLAPNEHMSRIQEWIDLSFEEKFKIRHINYSNILQKALKKAFPKTASEYAEMKPHDTRHSYAVNLLQKGVSISLIAKLLGNGVAVCEKYYLTYALGDEALDLVDSIVQANTGRRLKIVGGS